MSDIIKGVLGTVISAVVITLCSLFFTPLFRVLTPLFLERMTLEETQALISAAWLFIVILLVAIVFLVIWLILIQKTMRQCKRRLSELEGKAIPEVVKGKGYCIDKRNGEPLCPSCWAHGITSYMRVVKYKGNFLPDALYCNACSASISIDTTDESEQK